MVSRCKCEEYRIALADSGGCDTGSSSMREEVSSTDSFISQQASSKFSDEPMFVHGQLEYALLLLLEGS